MTMRFSRTTLAFVCALICLVAEKGTAFSPTFSGQRTFFKAELRSAPTIDTATKGRQCDLISPICSSPVRRRSFIDNHISVQGLTLYASKDDTETEEELSYAERTLKKVKESGKAGVISYALWELAFWLISIPVCIFGYYEFAGHWPDLTNKEDLEKVGAEAFAFVNFARFAVPLRLGLAFSTIPFIQKNIVDRFLEPKSEDSSASS